MKPTTQTMKTTAWPISFSKPQEKRMMAKFPKYMEFIELYKISSAMEFAFAQVSIATGAATGTKKGVIDLLRRILPENVWKTQLLDPKGKRIQIRDINVHAIIESITTKSVKTVSQDTQDALTKLQQEPVWADGIHQYISNLLKNVHELINIGFNTDYSLLMHRVKFQLESFTQTPQGKTF